MMRLGVFAAGGLILVAVIASGCARKPTYAAAPAALAPAPADTGYGLRAATVEYVAPSDVATALPPNAAPGECYIRAAVPARYDTVKQRVVKKPAATRIEVVPPQFQEVEERVLVRPATTRLEVVPPTTEEVEERVVVRPATTRLEVVPARTRTVTERVVTRPAYTVWKRSTELAPGERPQQTRTLGSGDLLCLVEVPAEYATVTREVIDTPATTRTVDVPAEYATVRKTVVKTPGTTRQVEVPAEYRTVKVQKMAAPAREVKTEVPAEFEEVATQVLRAGATTEWRAVLCETNASPATLAALQQALKRAGFDPGRADGRVDARTLGAVRAFQQARGLPVDDDRYISMATVKALGVTSEPAASPATTR